MADCTRRAATVRCRGRHCIRKSMVLYMANMPTLVRRPVCTLFTTSSGLGKLDFDLKVASLHIQWMWRLPLNDPSKCRLFAKFWFDRVTSLFGGWEEILNGLNVSGIPTFYGTFMSHHRWYSYSHSTSLSTFTLLEPLFCRNIYRSPPLLWIVLVCI